MDRRNQMRFERRYARGGFSMLGRGIRVENHRTRPCIRVRRFLPARLDGCQVILDKSRSIVISIYSWQKREEGVYTYLYASINHFSIFAANRNLFTPLRLYFLLSRVFLFKIKEYNNRNI